MTTGMGAWKLNNIFFQIETQVYRFLGFFIDNQLIKYLILIFILLQQGFEAYSLELCFNLVFQLELSVCTCVPKDICVQTHI